MAFRLLSAVVAGFTAWAALMQRDDPDPERWMALYGGAAVIALASTCGRPLPRAATWLAAVALSWAAFLVPELVGRWSIADLAARMSPERPEVEYGRELGGLLIVATYCVAAAWKAKRPGRADGASTRIAPPPR